MKNQTKPRVLIFIDWYSPGYKAGGPVRSIVNLTAHLADEFDFFIVTRNTEYGENAPYDTVDSDIWSALSPGVKVWYSSAGKPSIKLWKHLIKETAPNVVYINGIYSPKFSLFPLIAARQANCKKIIVAPRGMLATSAIQVKGSKKHLFLTAAKWMKLFDKVFWHATNKNEADQIITRLSIDRDKIFGAANLPRVSDTEMSGTQKKEFNLRLLSLARIAPEKNTLYAIECLSLLKPISTVTMDLYGQIYDQSYWQLCEKKIANLSNHIKVNYRGTVDSESIPETLQKYNALFLPSRGENFGHVIIESFMAGRPVVISDQTPWRNLSQTKSGWDLPLSDPSKYAEVLEFLASMNQEEYDEWCKGAWTLGQSVVNDESVVEVYKQMLGQ